MKKALKNNKAYFTGKTDSELLRQREWMSPFFIIKKSDLHCNVHVAGVCVGSFVPLCVAHVLLVVFRQGGLGKLW